MRTLGEFKNRLERAKATILQWINFSMITYIFIGKAGFSWWYLLLLPVIVLYLWIDKGKMHGQEIDYTLSRSQKWKKLLKDVEEIKIILKKD